jgi:hypothetical protein
MRYKNTSDQDLALPDFGIVKAGEVLVTDKVLNNPNFVEVQEDSEVEEKESIETED